MNFDVLDKDNPVTESIESPIANVQLGFLCQVGRTISIY